MPICPHCGKGGETLFAPCVEGDGYYLIDEKDWKEAPSDRWLGRRLGDRFVISSIIGEGSMGYVYKAFQEQVERMVAIKIFEVGADGQSEGSRQRFIQEARVLARVSHPNCVTLYDFGYEKEGQFLYIAMEYVGGISLRRAIRRGLKMDAILEILRQVLMALREAHALEIVHRDLKPENIILSYRKTSDEQIVKVLDFGIAKLLHQGQAQKTRVGLLFGTPAYMSPEQCQGRLDITPASDLYSLGCMAYEMVCGRLPFVSERPQEMVRMQIEAPIPPLEPRPKVEVPAGFEEFVRTCMAKDPGERYANASIALGVFDGIRGATSQLSVGPMEEVRRRVTVPKNRVSGVELDPVGEARRRAMQEDRPSPVVEVDPKDAPLSRVTDTMRGRPVGGPMRAPVEDTGDLGRLKRLLMALLACLLLVALLAAVMFLVR